MADGIDLHKITAVSGETGAPGFDLLFNSKEAAVAAYEALEDTMDGADSPTAGQYIDLVDDYETMVSTRRDDWKFIHLQRLAMALEGDVQLQLLKARVNRSGIRRNSKAEEMENKQGIVPVSAPLIGADGRPMR